MSTSPPRRLFRSLTILAFVACVACGSEEETYPTVQCPTHALDEAGAAMDGDPQVAERFAGQNGEFVDTCDAEGNLVQYRCDWDDCSNEWDFCGVFTGAVDSRTVDCDGACVDGACP